MVDKMDNLIADIIAEVIKAILIFTVFGVFLYA